VHQSLAVVLDLDSKYGAHKKWIEFILHMVIYVITLCTNNLNYLIINSKIDTGEEYFERKKKSEKGGYWFRERSGAKSNILSVVHNICLTNDTAI
jgi:hypothetical protein